MELLKVILEEEEELIWLCKSPTVTVELNTVVLEEVDELSEDKLVNDGRDVVERDKTVMLEEELVVNSTGVVERDERETLEEVGVIESSVEAKELDVLTAETVDERGSEAGKGTDVKGKNGVEITGREGVPRIMEESAEMTLLIGVVWPDCVLELTGRSEVGELVCSAEVISLACE